MKVTCLKKDIEEAVETAARVASPSATLPVLQCVVCEAGEKDITVKATNLEIGVERKCTADVGAPGKIAVPAQTLLATLKAAPPNTTVVLEVQDTTLQITIGGSHTTIKTVPVDDFPTISKPEGAIEYTLDQEKLTKGIRAVLYSASTSLIKPELSSVYSYHQDNTLFFVATDSFRLAEKKISHQLTEHDADIPPVIIPAKNATELLRILEAHTPSTLTISVEESQFSIHTPDLFVTSRSIDGSFPDYQSILPKTNTTEVVLLKEDFTRTLKKVQIFSDKFGQMTMHIYPNKKTFTVSARNDDVGEVFDELEATLSGDDLDISFNHRYVAECLQSLTGDSLSLSFAGIGKPLIIRGVGEDSFTYLVMPMNR